MRAVNRPSLHLGPGRSSIWSFSTAVALAYSPELRSRIRESGPRRQLRSRTKISDTYPRLDASPCTSSSADMAGESPP